FWREKMDGLSWAGAGVICFAGIVASQQMRRNA
ncbi:MAG: hypothetical protein ACI9TH_002128, partial [Kiritimatiellia bacterium]